MTSIIQQLFKKHIVTNMKFFRRIYVLKYYIAIVRFTESLIQLMLNFIEFSMINKLYMIFFHCWYVLLCFVYFIFHNYGKFIHNYIIRDYL